MLKLLVLIAAAASPGAAPLPWEDDRTTWRSLCTSVHFAREYEGGVPDPWGFSRFDYHYQMMLFREAGVEATDTPSTINKKLRVLWVRRDLDWQCTSPAFDVYKGHVLKFAIHRRFTAFINDAALWRVNLNIIDASDGRTALDYVASEMHRYRGTAIFPSLKGYYNTLEHAGARRRKEIDGVDCTLWPDASRTDPRCPPPLRGPWPAQ